MGWEASHNKGKRWFRAQVASVPLDRRFTLAHKRNAKLIKLAGVTKDHRILPKKYRVIIEFIKRSMNGHQVMSRAI